MKASKLTWVPELRVIIKGGTNENQSHEVF